jgi:Tfp pilus assembly protein PilX
MTIKPIVDTRSEKGMALVVVLLLMAVLSGLATGFAMNGQTEVAMAVNEVYYAGARAAAEAGMNRAVATLRIDNTANLLAGPDQLLDAVNAGAAENADNGNIGFLLTGASPYAVDGAGQYRYTIQVFDDDDPDLYDGVALTGPQLAAMGENGIDSGDLNSRYIIRATGFGPSNTVVRLARVLQSTANVAIVPATTLNPAILVDGDLVIDGNINLWGAFGSVHANGNLEISGNSADVSQDATASGEFTANQNFDAGGKQGGGYASVNMPAVDANSHLGLADYVLHDDGVTKTNRDGTPCAAACADWTFADGSWTLAGNSAPTGTFFVEGSVSISGSPKGPGNTAIKLSLITTGSISITGAPKLAPDDTGDRDAAGNILVPGLSAGDTGNPEKFQFITNGDLFIGGNVNADDPTQVEGQIFVKEQFHMHGNPSFQGRIIVQNEESLSDLVTENTIGGTPSIRYEGTLPGYQTQASATTTYTNNFSGWVEQ